MHNSIYNMLTKNHISFNIVPESVLQRKLQFDLERS